jgi:cytochrome b561
MNSAATVWPLSLRIAHWLNAALVIGALGLGAFMVLAVHDAATRFELIQTHKSIGVSVLVLTVLRFCLRSVMRVPKPEPTARSLAMIARPCMSAFIFFCCCCRFPAGSW